MGSEASILVPSGGLLSLNAYHYKLLTTFLASLTKKLGYGLLSWVSFPRAVSLVGLVDQRNRNSSGTP